MKVLLTNHHLAGLTGSETATWTIARALREAGHDCRVFSFAVDVTVISVGRALHLDGFPLTSRLRLWRHQRFDVAHCHHRTTAAEVRKFFPGLPILYLGHGVLPEVEAPPAPKLNVAVHAAVSEEIAGHWRREFGVEHVEVVRNAVDTERFSPRSPVRDRPERVFLMKTRGQSIERVKAACRSLGAEFSFHEGAPVWRVEDLYDGADLVIGIGRCVLEAMACGRNVLVLNEELGDGFVRPSNYAAIRQANFSGRWYGRRFTADELAGEIGLYDPALGEKNRGLVKKHHDAADCAARLTRLYERAVAR